MKKRIVPLHSRLFLLTLFLGCIIAFTYINNYFFYKFKDDRVGQEIQRLEQTLGSTYTSCLAEQNVEFCQQQLKTIVSNSWDYGIIEITDKNNNMIISKNSEYYKENRSVVTKVYTVESSKAPIRIKIAKRSAPPIYKSVVRSCTLSIGEILSRLREGKSVESFIHEVAIPRSNVPIFTTLLCVILYLAVKWHIKGIFSQIEKLKSAQNFQHLGLLGLASEKEKLEATIQKIKDKKIARERQLQIQLCNEKEKSDKQLAEQLQEKQQIENDFWKEIEDYERKLDDVNKQVEQYQKESEKLAKQIEKLESQQLFQDGTINKKLKDRFLRNPKLKKRNKEEKYNIGSHHSKDFVLKVVRSVYADKNAINLVKEIKSKEFCKDKRGKVVFNILDTGEWALDVYDNGESGYCACVVLLTTNFAEAVLTAKYLTFFSSRLLKSKELVISNTVNSYCEQIVSDLNHNKAA